MKHLATFKKNSFFPLIFHIHKRNNNNLFNDDLLETFFVNKLLLLGVIVKRPWLEHTLLILTVIFTFSTSPKNSNLHYTYFNSKP